MNHSRQVETQSPSAPAAGKKARKPGIPGFRWLVRRVRRITGQLARIGKPKIYRLKGYSTVTRINKKFRVERYQRRMRSVLVIAFVILLLTLFLIWTKPFQDLSEYFRMFGIE